MNEGITKEAELTVKHAILWGITETGNQYIKPLVDCAGLIDSIFRALESPATLWAVKELARGNLMNEAETAKAALTQTDFWRVWEQFHAMWGKAKDGEPYNKEDWNQLQRLLQKVEKPSLPTVAL